MSQSRGSHWQGQRGNQLLSQSTARLQATDVPRITGEECNLCLIAQLQRVKRLGSSGGKHKIDPSERGREKRNTVYVLML